MLVTGLVVFILDLFQQAACELFNKIFCCLWFVRPLVLVGFSGCCEVFFAIN
jgi:hypothetical protein